MVSYLNRRLLLLLPTVAGVVSLVFLLVHLIPGDPVTLMLGEHARAVEVDALRRQLGLDQPLLVQYVDFWRSLLHGDLGSSFFYRRPVFAVILERLPATLALAVSAMAVALTIALPLGVLAAIRQYSLWDHAAMIFSLLGVSLPNFWLGPMLILLFAIHWNLLPVSGFAGITALVLPAITLGTALAAILSRMTRAGMLEVLRADYLTAARARGIREWRVIGRHALKNALLPVITIAGLQFGALLSGAIVTEQVFAWPGIGSLLIQAVFSRDYPVVQGCLLIISGMYIVINILTELLYTALDPRIRPK
jgi:peptide/nickel transport system permease protein